MSLARRPGEAARGATAELDFLSPGEAWQAHTGAFQLVLELDTRWQVDEDQVRLVDLQRRAPAEEVRATSAAAGSSDPGASWTR